MPGLAASLVAAALAIGIAPQLRAQSLQIIEREEPSLMLLHAHSQSYLGVDLTDVDQERAQALHLKDPHGAEITVLDHDAPAGKIGLKLHDVIVQMNGQTVEGAEQAKRILRETQAGHKVQLVISRDGAQQSLTVELTDRRKVQEEAREQLGTSVGGSRHRARFPDQRRRFGCSGRLSPLGTRQFAARWARWSSPCPRRWPIISA